MPAHRTVTFNSSSPPEIVNVQPISPVFVLSMELSAYWTCWTRRESNCGPKMLMQKAIPTPPSPPFYCTNRLLAVGRNIFLRCRRAEDTEAYPPGICVLDIESINVKEVEEMQKRKLGKTNLEVSAIRLGC